MTKLGWVLVGLTAIGGVVLVAKHANAAPALEGGGGGGGGRLGRVLQAVNVRSAPSPDAPAVSAVVPAGSTITVLETGIASKSPRSREWWRIVTPGGIPGFASAVGPAGEHNLELAAS